MKKKMRRHRLVKRMNWLLALQHEATEDLRREHRQQRRRQRLEEEEEESGESWVQRQRLPSGWTTLSRALTGALLKRLRRQHEEKKRNEAVGATKPGNGPTPAPATVDFWSVTRLAADPLAALRQMIEESKRKSEEVAVVSAAVDKDIGSLQQSVANFGDKTHQWLEQRRARQQTSTDLYAQFVASQRRRGMAALELALPWLDPNALERASCSCSSFRAVSEHTWAVVFQRMRGSGRSAAGLEAGWLRQQKGVPWEEWRRLSHWHHTIVSQVEQSLEWLQACTWAPQVCSKQKQQEVLRLFRDVALWHTDGDAVRINEWVEQGPTRIDETPKPNTRNPRPVENTPAGDEARG